MSEELCNKRPTKHITISHGASVNDFEAFESLRNALKNSCNDSIWMCPRFNQDTSIAEQTGPDYEFKRLEILKSYDVLDIDTDSSFERITALAARIFNVPICLVSIVDLGRQWFASNRGLGETKETERSVAFCSHAIISTLDMLIVNDATKDYRFKDNSLVTGDPKIRFYAGAPLLSPEGFKLGTVCIIDTKPWPNGLNLGQKQNLIEMSAMVMDTIVLRKKDREMMEKSRGRLIAVTAHEMLTPLTTMQLNLEMMNEDKALKKHMSENHKEILNTTIECAGLLTTICNQTIDSFRSSNKVIEAYKETSEPEEVVIADVLEKISHFIAPFRKKVAVSFHVADEVPPVMMSNSLIVFRSMLTVLIDSMESTNSGSVLVKISVDHLEQTSKTKGDLPTRDMLLFECSKPCSTSNGKESLNSEAAYNHIQALGGEFGYRRPRQMSQENYKNGTNGEDKKHYNEEMQWFTIPIVLPDKPKQVKEDKEEDKEKDKHDEKKLEALSNDTSNGKKRNKEELSDPVQSRKQFFKKPRLGEQNSSTTQLDEEEVHYSTPRVSSCTERKKVALIIDDTKIIRKVFNRALTSMGFVVKEAENGLKGLLEMKTVMFDIVFCDFLMPLMDGLDCVQQCRHWEKENRPWFEQYIVGISAHADNADAQRGLKVGMCKYMPKPISIKQLKEIVKSDFMKEKMKNLDNLARESLSRPFCLFADDVEVTDEERSLCTSDAEVSQRHFTCLIAEGLSEILATLSRCVERRGWRFRVVMNGVEALQMMKMRNWDAIFIGDNLPQLNGNTCVSAFRKWEAENRVARQRNIHIISAIYNSKSKRVPPECDGVLGTHFTQDDIVTVLNAGEKIQKKPSPL